MAPTEGTFLVHKEDSLLHTFMWLAGCLVVLSVDLNFALVSSFLPQEAMRRGVSSTWVGVIVASMSAGNVLAAPFAAKAVDRYGLLLVLTTALSAYSGLLVMMVIPSYQFTAVGFISTCLPLRLLQGVASSFAEVAATGEHTTDLAVASSESRLLIPLTRLDGAPQSWYSALLPRSTSRAPWAGWCAAHPTSKHAYASVGLSTPMCSQFAHT